MSKRESAAIRVKMGEHLVLLGTNGSGKTEFFRRVILPKTNRLLVVDTEERQFNDLQAVKTPSGDKVARAIPKGKPFRWRWVPPPTREVEEMDNLCNRLLARKEAEHMVLYIDELTDFTDAHFISPWFRAAARKSRKRHQSIVVGTQRPAGINKWLFDNSHHKVFFYVHEFDRAGLDKYWKGISEVLAAIEWGTFESIYIDPAGTVHHLKAAP